MIFLSFIMLTFLFINNVFSQTYNWEFLGFVDTSITDFVIDSNNYLYASIEPGAAIRSKDQGNTWETINNGITGFKNGQSITVDVNNNLFLACFGGLYKSTNQGDFWLRIGTEIPTLEFWTIEGLSNGALILNCFTGVYYSLDLGETWTQTINAYTGIEEFEEHTNGIVLGGSHTATGGGLYRSTDYGINWSYNAILTTSICSYSDSLLIASMYGEQDSSSIRHSTDDGLTWNYIQNSFIDAANISSIIRDDSGNIWLGSINDVFYSTDTSLTWTATNLNNNVLSLLFEPISNEIYCGTNSGLFKISTDITPVSLLFFTGKRIERFVNLEWQTSSETNNSGFEIQVLTNRLANGWQKIGFIKGHGTTIKPHSYSFTDNNPDRGTCQYRLKQIDFDGSFEYSNIVEVEINPVYKFRLEQNYPNPYSKGSGGNSTTVIKFSIPNIVGDAKFASPTANVTLKVYDVLGKEVTTLVNKKLSAGEYEVKFDGNGLPSGVYYYRLQAGNFAETKKMVLLR